MINILFLLGGFLIGCSVIYYVIQPKLKDKQKIDLEIQKRNEQIKQDNEILEIKYQQLSDDLVVLNTKKNEISASIMSMNEQAKETEKTLFESAQRTAEANFELSVTKMANEYNQAQIDYQAEYESMISDLADSFTDKMAEYNSQYNDIQLRIKDIQLKLEDQIRITQAAIEANKREQADKEQKNFYKIQIPEVDLEDIRKLRSIAPGLRNREPLDKVIWKTYYEKPTAGLIGRVIGPNIKCGIYKITNLDNGMCYIGQSVDITTRWKAHIKAGLGIDSTNNKLYTAMKEEGVENFMFEILEECERTKLNEQEKYWINYFHSESYGYNSTKGNG